MKSNHATHLELVQDSEQGHMQQHHVAAINQAARERRHENSMKFWHSIKQVVFVISMAAIIVYALIHLG